MSDDEVEEPNGILEEWKKLSPKFMSDRQGTAVHYTPIPKIEGEFIEEIINIRELEETLKRLKMAKKRDKELAEVEEEIEKIEDEMAELKKLLQKPRFKPAVGRNGGMIGRVVKPEDMLGMVCLLHPDVKKVIEEDDYYIAVEYDLRLSRRGKKYMKVFKAVRLSEVSDRLSELDSRFQELMRKKIRLLARRALSKYPEIMDLAEFARTHEVISKDVFLAPYTRFRKALIAVAEMSDEEIDAVNNLLFDAYGGWSAINIDKKLKSINAWLWVFSAKYVVFPVEFTNEKWDSTEKVELEEVEEEVCNKISPVIVEHYKVVDFFAYYPSLGGAIVYGVVLEPKFKATYDEIMDINKRLIELAKSVGFYEYPIFKYKRVSEQLYALLLNK